MGVAVKNFLKHRRDRAVGSVLGYAEREIFPVLTDKQRQELRRVVLDAMNSYHDSVLDLVKAEDGVRNDLVLEALERLETRMASQKRQAARQAM